MKRATEITKRRQKELGYKPLQPGEVRIYQLSRARVKLVPTETPNGDVVMNEELTGVPRRQEVPNTYIVKDYPNEASNSYLEIQEVGYFTGHKVSRTKDGVRQQIPDLKEIYFTLDERGQIRCDSGKQALDAHLFFSPLNESNAGKEGYSRPRNGYLFKILDTNKKSEDFAASRKRVAKAILMIEEWDESFLRQAANALSVRQEIDLPAGEVGIGEIKEKMMILAERKPERIMHLSEDISIKVYALYKDAINGGILSCDGVKIKWAETNNDLCIVPPGISPEEAFKSFVLDQKHKEVLERIEDALEPENA